jgi:DNA polymerase
MRDRGQFISTRYSENTIATVHPSAVLRASEAGQAAQFYDFIRTDLKLAWSRATEPVQDSSEGGDGFTPMEELSIAIHAQTVRNERHT